MLEKGILEEVIRLLRAAQREGDVYLYPKVNDLSESPSQEEPFTLSKFAMALSLLPALMLDARTTRFVWKAIPDILSILEGAYFSLAVVFTARDWEMREPVTRLQDDVKLRDDHKVASLSALAMLAEHLGEARKRIGSRKALIRRILQDCLANTDESTRTIHLASVLFLKLVGTCDLSEFLHAIIETAFKALTALEDALTIKTAITLLAHILLVQGCEGTLKKLIEFRSNPRAEKIARHLLALASCPSLEQDYRGVVYLALAPLKEEIMTVLEEDLDAAFLTPSQQAKLEQLFAGYPEAIDRREKLQKIFTASDQSGIARGPKEPGLLFDTPEIFFQKHSVNPLQKPPDGRTYIPIGISEGSQVQLDKKLRRKCSRLSCSQVEAASCEVCSGCRLAVYCSRGRSCEPVSQFNCNWKR